MVWYVDDESRSVSKLYLGTGNYSMVRYVDNECCHVSSLQLVISNVWHKVTIFADIRWYVCQQWQ